MMKFKLWKAVACLAVLAVGAGRGEAAPVSVADLLVPGATFVSGDKTFSNFHNFTETGANPVGAANIFLSAISQPNRNLTDPANFPLPAGQPACGTPCPTEYGFRASAPWAVGQNGNYSFGLDFTVTSTGACCIYGVENELTAHAVNGYVLGSMNVTKGLVTLANVGTAFNDPGAHNTLDRDYFDTNGNGVPVANVYSAHVSMGLTLHADNVAGALAGAQHVDVYFAQAIPEPSTYALLVLGSAGVGLMVRRKRS